MLFAGVAANREVEADLLERVLAIVFDAFFLEHIFD
jgi:hypothetical protein